jgi:hypothetical protein
LERKQILNRLAENFARIPSELTDKKMGTHGNQKWPKLNTLETKMAKISHTKIKQPSFGENI